MRTKLMVVALVALTVALSWWRHGGRTVDASRAGQSQKPVAIAATAKVSSQPLLSLAKAGPRAAAPVSVPDAEFPLRLRNTAKPIAELIRDNRAILLENALIDSRVPGGVAVPQRLKSAGTPGAYIVQARSKIDLAFKRQIEAAGGVVVSYIPNNAYLVKMDDAGYQRLSANGAVQSVYAYEPYYKLDSYLLTSLTSETIAPKQETVRVTLFAGGEQAGIDAIQQANGQVVGRDRSPFGPELIAQISSKDLVMLAQSSSVQAIARQGQFQYLNDLARERVRVSATTNSPANYLGLYGANVYVNVNDSGVDTTHPALLGRILPSPTTLTNDTSGHGTHVAGTIASSGLNSPGSADYRGMASQASILSLDAYGYPTISDLFETAARSNMFVFNLTNAL
ncbi:MAG TPA: S8 family serine peptidase, partial [Roseimicrobium sp.]|nr:S8 family serine peptidase [Roseimicrobium sp.]